MSAPSDNLQPSPPGPSRPVRGTVVAALGALGLVSLAALAAAVPASAGGTAHSHTAASGAAHVFDGVLSDLQPATGGPLDGARARVVHSTHHGSSTFVLVVSGVAAGGVGHTYGAHLHTGPCVAGDGAMAGAHYNQSTVNGVVPLVVSDQTEVWLDVTVGADRGAVAVAHVPFVPVPGNHAVVLHEKATDDHGTAGARLACLPVSWS